MGQIVNEPRRTPLYETHIKMGGKIVDFGGWALPVQYSGIIEEHNAVRQTAGVFDVSHMGEIEISGPDAFAALQKLLSNNMAKISPQHILYSPMCYPNGGVVDDLLVYCFSKEKYMLVVNGSNIEKDFNWIKENTANFKNVNVVDLSDRYGLIALQGPKSLEIIKKVFAGDIESLPYFAFMEGHICEKPCFVSRTGYTGEDGYEVYADSNLIVDIYNDIFRVGQEAGLKPCGLGSRDTLRFEAALPLYGNELGQDITPLEARLKIFVDLSKDFIGAEAMRRLEQEGINRQLIGFEMVGKGIARHGYPIECEGKVVGSVTSGSFSPSLGKNLGLGLLNKDCAKIGNALDIIIRGKPIEAKIVKLPFYKRGGK